jgi:hypothetical protein
MEVFVNLKDIFAVIMIIATLILLEYYKKK